MLELAREKRDIVRSEISKDDALKMFGDKGDVLKLELISELADGPLPYTTRADLRTYAVARTCRIPVTSKL
jgi:threonyl-tRNA synthetase